MAKLKLAARLVAIAVCLITGSGYAAGSGDAAMEEALIDPSNIASLQRGARNYMNYCSGCHSAQYVRFKTVGSYLELSEDQLVNNLMFNAEKSFETIRSSMATVDAERWYGVAPPDLSLMARAKGADYIYNFLKGFYLDPESPTGVDNVVLAGTSMPHVLWELQGFQNAVFSEHIEGGVTTSEFEHFELAVPGRVDLKDLGVNDYDEFVRDTVNFLAYIAEPVRAERRMLGTWVIIYLLVFLIIAGMLKKQIWKDVS